MNTTLYQAPSTAVEHSNQGNNKASSQASSQATKVPTYPSERTSPTTKGVRLGGARA